MTDETKNNTQPPRKGPRPLGVDPLALSPGHNVQARVNKSFEDIAAELEQQQLAVHQDLASSPASIGEAQPPEKVQNQNKLSETTTILPLSSIDPPTISQRVTYTREMVDRMATAIRRQALGKASILDGQINPIIVVPHATAPGRYVIVDGFTRFQAFVSNVLGTEIKATIRTGLREDQVFAISFASNVDRNGTNDIDQGNALALALAKGVFRDGLHIAEVLGYTDAKVSGLLAFSKLPDYAIAMIKETPQEFTYNVVARLQALINKNPPEEQVVATIKKIAEGKLTFKKLNQIVSDYSNKSSDSKKKSRRDTRNILGYGKVRATETALSLELQSLPENLTPQLIDIVEQAVSSFLKQHIPSEAVSQHADSHNNSDAD